MTTANLRLRLRLRLVNEEIQSLTCMTIAKVCLGLDEEIWSLTCMTAAKVGLHSDSEILSSNLIYAVITAAKVRLRLGAEV